MTKNSDELWLKYVEFARLLIERNYPVSIKNEYKLAEFLMEIEKNKTKD
jgi:hypothetical protein